MLEVAPKLKFLEDSPRDKQKFVNKLIALFSMS
jgi:hypothetical protein